MDVSAQLHVEYDGAAPPVPKRVKVGWWWRARLQKQLGEGCHALSFEPRVTWKAPGSPGLPNAFLGPLRVEYLGRTLRASGDLYVVSADELSRESDAASRSPQDSGAGVVGEDTEAPGQSDAQGEGFRLSSIGEIVSRKLGALASETAAIQALQFPQDFYRYYLALSGVEQYEDELRLHLLSYRYTEDRGWLSPQPVYFTAVRPGSNEPSARLHNALGTAVGTVSWHHLNPGGSSYLNRIARVADLEVEALEECKLKGCRDPTCAHPKLKKPDDQRLWDNLRGSGWRVRVKSQPHEVGKIPLLLEEPPWQPSDLRKYLRSREEAKADEPKAVAAKSSTQSVWPRTEPWSYSLQVAPMIHNGQDEKVTGFMYATRDKNARMGAALSARAPAYFGSPRPELQDSPRRFHLVAIHEFGHMQGLYHGESGPLVATSESLLPGFLTRRWVRLKHAREDAARLRHFPDAWVRPRGLPFGHGYRSSPVEIQDLVPECPLFKLRLVEVNQRTRVPSELFKVGLGDRLASIRLRLKPTDESTEILSPPYSGSPHGAASVWIELPSGEIQTLASARLPPMAGQGTSSGPTRHGVFFRGTRPWRFNATGIYSVTAELFWTAGSDYYRVRTRAQIVAR